jgi:hypothetical protein
VADDPNSSLKCVVDKYSVFTKNTDTGTLEKLVSVDNYKIANINAGTDSPLTIDLSKV